MEIIFRYVNDIIFTCSLLGKIQLSIHSQQVIAEANWDIVSCSRPSEDRTIPLNIIAERTKLSVEDVEYLLMKSLSVSPCISEICISKMFKIRFEHLLPDQLPFLQIWTLLYCFEHLLPGHF